MHGDALRYPLKKRKKWKKIKRNVAFQWRDYVTFAICHCSKMSQSRFMDVDIVSIHIATIKKKAVSNALTFLTNDYVKTSIILVQNIMFKDTLEDKA